jgi:predicted acyl esterase
MIAFRRLFAVLGALCIVLSLGVGVPTATATTQDPPDTPIVFAPHGLSTDRFPEATTPEGVDVRAHDGVMLHARVYRPDTSSDPGWKTPIILVHSPYYGNTPSRSMDLVHRYTPRGYTVVLSSVRGTGDSGGCLEQDGPNQAKDFKTLVEYFASQP